MPLRGASRTALSRAIKQVTREVKAKSPLVRLQAIRVLLALFDADHHKVHELTKRLLGPAARQVGYYYRAMSKSYQARYGEALADLDRFLAASPDHLDGLYLRGEIVAAQGDKDAAWTLFAGIAARSPRAKTWSYLSNLVETPEDFERLLALYESPSTKKPPRHAEATVKGHLATAALIAGNAQAARGILKAALLEHGPAASPPSRGRGFSAADAARALSDLKTVFDRAGVPFFLVSGTLLGCIRENRILGHDKDLDVGIWSDISMTEVSRALRASGFFRLHTQRWPTIQRIAHMNGVAIDVFQHHIEDGWCWHGSVKMWWRNTPFKLVPRRFLGGDYLIPQNYELYLTENYGEDWRTPKIDFDCVYDTPNGSIARDELVAHALQKLLQPATRAHGRQHIRALTQNEEGDFVRSYTRIVDVA